MIRHAVQLCQHALPVSIRQAMIADHGAYSVASLAKQIHSIATRESYLQTPWRVAKDSLQ
jgi:hypothetical protein